MSLKIKKHKYFLLLFAFFGVFLILLGSYSLYYSKRILSFSGNPYTKDLPSKSQNLFPYRLIIDRLGIDIPIKEGKIVNGIWEISSDSATHLINSSLPSETGNIVIYGHNTKAILGRLSVIKENDEIKVITNDNKIYRYKVTYIKWVRPDDIEVVSPTNYSILTLYTCTGFLDEFRLVVKALPLG